MGTQPVVEPPEEPTEFQAAWGDKSLRAKSKYMAEITGVLSLILLIAATAVGATVGYQHLLDTKEQFRAVAESIKERDAAMTAVFKELAQSQKEMVAAQREQNCLIAIPQDARFERANLCRSIGR